MSYEQATSATAAKAADQLRAWAGSAAAPQDKLNECCLERTQQVRLWNLLRTPSKPGVLSNSDVPR